MIPAVPKRWPTIASPSAWNTWLKIDATMLAAKKISTHTDSITHSCFHRSNEKFQIASKLKLSRVKENVSPPVSARHAGHSASRPSALHSSQVKLPQREHVRVAVRSR